jgi:hypothetical protein
MEPMDFLNSPGWSISIDPNGTWRCHHVDFLGNSQPSTLLNLQDAEEEWPDGPPDRRYYRAACPDCGTWWRIYPRLLAAQYYAAPPHGATPVVPRQASYRQPIQRDIHAIMTAVRSELPGCMITQEAAYLPTTNDDGIWYVRLPCPGKEVQIESTYGMCPFLVEINAESGPTARTFTTVEEIVAVIISDLTS